MGEILVTLKNCTELVAIDFGENNLSETIPTWFGKRFSKLDIVSLRSNHFYGGMPNSVSFVKTSSIGFVSESHHRKHTKMHQ